LTFFFVINNCDAFAKSRFWEFSNCALLLSGIRGLLQSVLDSNNCEAILLETGFFVMDHSIEIEVKFYVPQADPVRERILALGASCLGRVFEVNVCFDDDLGTMKNHGDLLRLRKDHAVRLTFKSIPREADGDYKMYKELEVEVSDFNTCRAILESLGFHPVRTYEKWRETFVLGDTHLLLDTTPYGIFLEIEGRKEGIREAVERLGFQWQERILLNYLAIFEVIRRGSELSFNDMTFENFRSVDCDVVPYLSCLYAG
jgi:adenylate cyclase class 2